MERGTKSYFIIVVILVIVLGVYSFVALQSEQGYRFSPQGVGYHGNEIAHAYSAGQKISGTVNLSFSDVLGSSSLTSNFEGEISLLDFFDANGLLKDEDYNCSTSNCLDDYTAKEEITGLAVDNAGENIAGYSISASGVFSVDSVRLGVNSNIFPQCYLAPLRIDVLNNGGNLIGSNKDNNGALCANVYIGCFNGEFSNQDIAIDNRKYCELIQLPAAPKFQANARIKNDTSNQAELKMLLYKFDDISETIGECVLPKHSNANQGVYENLACVIDYSSPVQDDYLVCVTSSAGATDYRMRFETSGQICGTNSIGNFGDLTVDYDISAKALKFGVIEGLQVHEAFFETYNFELSDYVEDYISETYNGDCEPACVIPLEFFGESQNLQFSNVKINFTSDQGFINNNKFYALEIRPVSVESTELELDLGKAKFMIPIGSKEDEFKFYVNGELVFESQINISESFDFNLKPRFALFGRNTLFSAKTIHNITNSEWDFGDGKIGSADGKEIFHTYTEEGEFDLEVNLVRSDGVESTKVFTIVVGDAKEFANITLVEYRNRIENIDSQIAGFDEWISSALRQEIDIFDLNSSLNAIQNSYNLANSDSEYQQVALDLLDLRIPINIDISEKANEIPLLIGFGNIDTDYIETLSGSSVSDTDILESNIASWMSENLNSIISFEKISGFYDDGIEVILSKFEIETRPLINIPNSYFLIIGTDIQEDGDFMLDYNQNTISGDGTYISLDAGPTNEIFEFYVFGEFDPENLGSYISPNIAEFGDLDYDISPCNSNNLCEEGIGEDADNCPSDCQPGRWPWAVLWIVVLLFAALIVYVMLQEWYKKNYEKSLFKNKDDLYNLLNFIYNARKSGLTDREIRGKLSDAKWKGEKISYAFKKISGSRIGMYEIPVLKFIENRKVKKELAKRQKKPVDLRFVKSPNSTGNSRF